MKKAFTLVELVVLILIIGILAMLATVALKSAREKKITITTLNCEKYANDSIEYLPVGCYEHFGINTGSLPGQN
jgi:prepilin-type N-terminal cleavage/methylation domain-containing protein